MATTLRFIDIANVHSNRSKDEKKERSSDHHDVIITPTENDILCGRGRALGKRPGNRTFIQTVRRNLPEYIKATKRVDKSLLVARIVDELQNDGARFLRKHHDEGGEEEQQQQRDDVETSSSSSSPSSWKQEPYYVELDIDQARDKTGHALRDLLKAEKQKASASSSSAKSSKKKHHGPNNKNKKKKAGSTNEKTSSSKTRMETTDTTSTNTHVISVTTASAADVFQTSGEATAGPSFPMMFPSSPPENKTMIMEATSASPFSVAEYLDESSNHGIEDEDDPYKKNFGGGKLDDFNHGSSPITTRTTDTESYWNKDKISYFEPGSSWSSSTTSMIMLCDSGAEEAATSMMMIAKTKNKEYAVSSSPNFEVLSSGVFEISSSCSAPSDSWRDNVPYSTTRRSSGTVVTDPLLGRLRDQSAAIERGASISNHRRSNSNVTTTSPAAATERSFSFGSVTDRLCVFDGFVSSCLDSCLDACTGYSSSYNSFVDDDGKYHNECTTNEKQHHCDKSIMEASMPLSNTKQDKEEDDNDEDEDENKNKTEESEEPIRTESCYNFVTANNENKNDHLVKEERRLSEEVVLRHRGSLISPIPFLDLSTSAGTICGSTTDRTGTDILSHHHRESVMSMELEDCHTLSQILSEIND